MWLRIESAVAMENSALKQASLSHGPHGLETMGPKHLWTQVISSHRHHHLSRFQRSLMPALQRLQAQQFTRLCTIILSLQPVQISDISVAKPVVFLKFISKSLTWDQKTFYRRNKFINGGTPQMPGWATASSKCCIDCTVPTSHYLFYFPGKVHSEF